MNAIALLIVGVLSYCLGRFAHKSNERNLLMMLKHRQDSQIVYADSMETLLKSQADRIAELESAANVAVRSFIECFEVKS